MRFLLLVFFLSLVNPMVGEAKPKGKADKVIVWKPLEIGRGPAEMPYRGGKKPVNHLYTLGSIDTGGESGRNTTIGIKRFKTPSKKPTKATTPKVRHKTKKTKKVPEVLGPNDKCFIPRGEDLTAAK